MSAKLKLLWAACVALIIGVILGVTAFKSEGPASSRETSSDGERIVMITHGQAADPYWNIVRNGAEEAARQMGVKLDYRAPETFDMIRMAELIHSATNQRPAGIIVSIPDASALGPVNPGRGAFRPACRWSRSTPARTSLPELGSLIHIGQDEYETGKRVGEALRRRARRRSYASITRSATPRSMPGARALRMALPERRSRSSDIHRFSGDEVEGRGGAGRRSVRSTRS